MMETLPTAAVDAGGDVTSLEGDRQISDLSTTFPASVGVGDLCDGDMNCQSCEVLGGAGDAVSNVADPPLSHKLTMQTSDSSADSAADTASPDSNKLCIVPPDNGFTGNLLAILMSNMNDECIESGDVSVVDAERTATGNLNTDVVDSSHVVDSSVDGYDSTENTPGDMTKDCCESSFDSNQLMRDTVDHLDKCKAQSEQTSDDSRTRSNLNEQCSDSPSSGISSCSVVTDLEEKLNTLTEDCVADSTRQYLGDQQADSTSDSNSVDGKIVSDPVELELARRDSTRLHSDDDSRYILPGEAFAVSRAASSNTSATVLKDGRVESPHTTADNVISGGESTPSHLTHTFNESSEKVTGVFPGVTTGTDVDSRRENGGHVTCGTNDIRTDAVSVDNQDHVRVRLGSSLSSDSDTIPCGSRHSTNDGKQYINLPLSSPHHNKDSAAHRDSHVMVRSATVRQGGQPGSHIQVQVELDEKKMDKLNRYNVHKLLERGSSPWQCDAHKGPHAFILTLLCMPVALFVSFVYSLYMGTLCWYNVLCYLYVEGTTLHKALLCPLLVLTYPILLFGTAMGVGLYASVVQVSWHLVLWQQKITDYEKGFYGWLCTALDMVQCAPYRVIVLDTDVVGETLEPSQDETDV
ncbi:hypothetical protein LSAT2_014164 [Lamellibrachia satsuma]|nr:hypothetical protein LSAT2_014164 [Lamellibrachia satsuma]